MMSEQFESKSSSAWPLHSDQTVASPPLPGIVPLMTFSESCFDQASGSQACTGHDVVELHSARGVMKITLFHEESTWE
jgi:hypothetical protein